MTGGKPDVKISCFYPLCVQLEPYTIHIPEILYYRKYVKRWLYLAGCMLGPATRLDGRPPEASETSLLPRLLWFLEKPRKMPTTMLPLTTLIKQNQASFSTLLSARQCKCHENPSNNYVRFRLNQIFPSACFQGKNALFYNISDCDLLAVPIYSLFHGALALVLSTWSINLRLIIVFILLNCIAENTKRS